MTPSDEALGGYVPTRGKEDLPLLEKLIGRVILKYFEGYGQFQVSPGRHWGGLSPSTERWLDTFLHPGDCTKCAEKEVCGGYCV